MESIIKDLMKIIMDLLMNMKMESTVRHLRLRKCRKFGFWHIQNHITAWRFSGYLYFPPNTKFLASLFLFTTDFSTYPSATIEERLPPWLSRVRVRKSRYWGEKLQVPHPLVWRNEASLLVQWWTMCFPLALWILVCVHRVLSAHRPVLLCAQNTSIRRYTDIGDSSSGTSYVTEQWNNVPLLRTHVLEWSAPRSASKVAHVVGNEWPENWSAFGIFRYLSIRFTIFPNCNRIGIALFFIIKQEELMIICIARTQKAVYST